MTLFVLPRGLEPLILTEQVPKTCAYTNSATGAKSLSIVYLRII